MVAMRPERILVAEDDADIREVLQLSLELVGGFEVCLVSSGQQALDQAPLFAPHVILLDVMMPGMDGVQTLRALRLLPGLASVPVLFLTAKAQPDEIASYLREGACGVILKPFDPMQLGAQVCAHWRDA